MQFFNDVNEAKRYAGSRPYFHPLAIANAAETLGLEEAVPLGLDIACGTGQSAKALTEISESVIGFDISLSMLANAERNSQVRYVNARAEAMPFESSSFEISSCALAFHWFDRELFLRESWRILKPDRLLVVYNNGFTGIMRGNPDFQKWAHNGYPDRFPTPPRDSNPITEAEAAHAGFKLMT